MLNAISSWLVLHTGHGPMEWAQGGANVATTFGLLAAGIGAIYAAKSYQASHRLSSHQHVHDLFRKYLRLRFEVIVEEKNVININNSERLTAAKLYVLEEMYVWIEREKSSKFSVWGGRQNKQEWNDYLGSWKSTIEFHARDDREGSIESLLNYLSCYSLKFLEYIDPVLGDERLSIAVKKSRLAAEKKEPRPRGIREEYAALVPEKLHVSTGDAGATSIPDKAII